MKATRIKWDASMTARCLAKCIEHNLKPVIVKKHVSNEAAARKKTVEATEMPAVSPVTKAVAIPKDTGWEDFKKAIDKAL